ncbi:unnamed protein product [Dibothriocephalus latus]|uniref:Uncharacterized protein n=1 Tax=Dibothriocephalus latus TaxID=60516 RepID=A0A3P7NPH7_DIBLA|nr:unnamed protein product [Dibothriocephalus latus]
MRKSNFSKRFLAETNLAITGSRLDLNLLVKDTGNGVLSTGSLESLELESLQRRLKKCDFDEVRVDNAVMCQPRLVDYSRGDGGGDVDLLQVDWNLERQDVSSTEVPSNRLTVDATHLRSCIDVRAEFLKPSFAVDERVPLLIYMK